MAKATTPFPFRVWSGHETTFSGYNTEIVDVNRYSPWCGWGLGRSYSSPPSCGSCHWRSVHRQIWWHCSHLGHLGREGGGGGGEKGRGREKGREVEARGKDQERERGGRGGEGRKREKEGEGREREREREGGEGNREGEFKR